MGREEIIRDRYGNRRGSIVERPDGRHIAYDGAGNRLGEYQLSNNTTYDKWSNRAAIGNILTNFIPKDSK